MAGELLLCKPTYPDVKSDTGVIEDVARLEYILRHIDALRDARDRGVNVAGYFVWSLMDNFEWGRGYSKLFGTVHVDRSTMARTVKASALWYRDFLAG
jgi:beta-glucosidase